MTDRSTPPLIRDFGCLTLPPENIVDLPNGITLHVFNYGDRPVSRLSLLMEGGANDAPRPEAMKLMTRLMCECPSGMTPEQMSELMDFNGAWLMPFLSDHYAGIQLYSLNSRLEEVLSTVVDTMFHSGMPVERLPQLRETAASQLAVAMNRPAEMASRINAARIYGADNPSARLATPDGVMEFTHDFLLDLYNRWHRGRCHAYISGLITPQILDLYTQALSALPASDGGITPTIQPYTPESPGLVTFDMPHSLQSAVEMVIPVPITRSHPDYIPLQIAVAALGGYFGSRLMMEVRERRGLTYGIHAGIYGSLEGTYMKVETQCDNANSEEVVEAVSQEVVRLAAEPPCGDELVRLRRYLTTSQAAQLDTPFTAADNYIYHLTLGAPLDYFDSKSRIIATMTEEKIAEMTRRYLSPGQFRTAIAGRF